MPITDGTCTTFPDRSGTWFASVVRLGPRIWSRFTTLIPFLIAFSTSPIRLVPKIGCTMIASYCPELAAVWSWANCFFGSLFASKTVIFPPPVAAAAFAAASIGAS